jgi:hypothetical protein
MGSFLLVLAIIPVGMTSDCGHGQPACVSGRDVFATWIRIDSGCKREQHANHRPNLLYTRADIPTSCASACQCLGCGTRRPARIADAYGIELPSADATVLLVSPVSSG